MIVTRKAVVEKLRNYLHHRLPLAQLVDWAATVMMEDNFEDQYFAQLRDLMARLGLADVKDFWLTWEICQAMLQTLGYRAQIDIVPSESALRIAEDIEPYDKKEQ